MFKKIILILILIIISSASYKYLLPVFSKSDQIINIDGNEDQYKFKPNDKEGKSFNGDTLQIYEITREKLLPDVEVKSLDVDLKVLSKINTEDKTIISKNTYSSYDIFLQLGSYKTEEKAKNFIRNFKEKNFQLINNLNLNITSANLPERGTYYRVRLGPFNDNKDIFTLCIDLKLENNECLIVKDK
ncbi:MAG: hypothetical protein CFH33_00710 [Alphaproteobacteria bacterium MarineAlpha9_Bin3]|nr:MAG: hypothetical protein CFH33_00710 [Alphaproteobacteria bacterium MarineAlpha9_Bin3]|tara:strand:+ start:3026 stop:3586 length:561 start_codon:yes stop_codon:yes gene_type:complete